MLRVSRTGNGAGAAERRLSARRRGRLPSSALAVATLLILALLPTMAAAQEDPTQVRNLRVEQHDGFATLAWDPVAGATDYQIERTPVDDSNVPTGPAVIRGLWRPNRQINQSSPTFADSGFSAGARFGWRVRARFGTAAQTYSEPVYGTTLPPFGPSEFLTQFELTEGAQFTSYEAEVDWTYRLAAASDRVRVVTLGHTVLGREINLFVIGHPAPPATAAAISASPTVASGCNVHGNEPSGREGCFMMIRKLAFSDDPWVVDILSNATVLIVPSLNGDGRAANSRGNTTGQDLNRDYGRLTQPETQAMIRFWRDYTPEVMNDGHEFGNNNTCDLSLMNTPQLNNAQSTYDEARFGLIEGWIYSRGAEAGWWPCPYPTAFSAGGQSFGNTAGHKHIIGMLTEARSGAGPTRPGEGSGAENRRRKAYSQLWTVRELLDYHRTNRAAIQQAIAESIAFQTSNTGPVVFDGTYDWLAYPAPHPGEVAPPLNRPSAGDQLVTPPCGYLLTEEQYRTPLTDGGSLPAALRTTAEDRLGFHGIAVQSRPAGHIVRMAQPLRGLIPLILDAQAGSLQIPIIVPAQRLMECPHATVAPAGISVAAVEETTTTASVTVANIATEPDQPLDWTITEAESDCAAPTDLGWVRVGDATGTTASSSSTVVQVTFDASGLVAPAVHEGLLCFSSNDPGEPLITVPVRLQVQYPLTGFKPPVAAPPALNGVRAGQAVPVRFSLDGDRGLSLLADGSPWSQTVDCVTRAATGAPQQAAAAGNGGLQYDAAADTYNFVWATSAAWRATCRKFVLALDDGSEHVAYFALR